MSTSRRKTLTCSAGSISSWFLACSFLSSSSINFVHQVTRTNCSCRRFLFVYRTSSTFPTLTICTCISSAYSVFSRFLRNTVAFRCRSRWSEWTKGQWSRYGSTVISLNLTSLVVRLLSSKWWRVSLISWIRVVILRWQAMCLLSEILFTGTLIWSNSTRLCASCSRIRLDLIRGTYLASWIV